MKILKYLETIADLGNSKEQLQKKLNIFEGGYLWDILVSRYDIVENTQILRNFAQDPDLKIIIKQGLDTLKEQVADLENF